MPHSESFMTHAGSNGLQVLPTTALCRGQVVAATHAFLDVQVAEVLVEAALQHQAQNKVVEIVASKKEDAPPKDKWFA